MGFKDELIDFNEKCASANYRDDTEINEEDNEVTGQEKHGEM